MIFYLFFLECFYASFTLKIYHFLALNEFYYLPFRKLKEFWDRAANGGRKSFRRDELSDDFIISTPGEEGILIPYLDLIQKDLDER